MTDATQPRMARRSMLPVGMLAAALVALLAFAPFASAAPDPIGSGMSKLYLKKGFEKKLDNLDVKVVKYGSGTVKGHQLQVAVNVTGGSVDPLTGQGNVTNKMSGGFKLKYGKRTVPIYGFEVNTTKEWVRATIAGATMKLGSLAKMSFSRNGFGSSLVSGRLALTDNAAKRISNKLGLRNALSGGRVISNSYTNAQPSTVAILGEQTSTQLALSKEALVKLASLPVPVKLSLIPPATVAGVSSEATPIASFPITGGEISPYATVGTVMHSGGLKLEQNLEKFGKGITTLEMANIWLDFGAKTASVEVIITNPVETKANLGNLGRASIADIDLSGAVITSDPVNRKVSVQNGYAALQAVTAATLNQVFAEPLKAGEVFKAGDPLGHFTFTAQTQ